MGATRKAKPVAYLLAVLFYSNLLAVALSQSPAPTPAPPACVAPEFRQFDFWLGKWTVKNPDGKVTGSSEITRASEGFAIREDWTSRNGQRGMSINYYDAAEKRWHQDWVGADGTILHLLGGLEGNAMAMSDATKTNRISWTPMPRGKVKQEWSTSTDGGETWQISFVGIYEPS